MLPVRKVSLLLSCALGALALMMSGPTQGATNQSSNAEDEGAKKEIMAVLKAHEEYWNRHDMDTWADKILHEDSDWVNWRGGYWHGKAAIREGHRAIHKAHYKNSRLSPQRVEDLTFITPDIALAHVRSELSGDERAPGQTFPYRKTILFTKQKGAWRIRALHNTRLLDEERPQPPPTSEEAKRIEAMVNKAAALVERQGKAAFSEFGKRDSEWWFGNTYLFAYDQNLNVLLNPAFPRRVGTNPRGETDTNGKAFHDEFLRVVRAEGAGWVDYMFPKPGQTQPSRKWSYVKGVNIDGTPVIIGAGFYPE